MEFKLFNSDVLFDDFVFPFESRAAKTVDLEPFDIESPDWLEKFDWTSYSPDDAVSKECLSVRLPVSFTLFK